MPVTVVQQLADVCRALHDGRTKDALRGIRMIEAQQGIKLVITDSRGGLGISVITVGTTTHK